MAGRREHKQRRDDGGGGRDGLRERAGTEAMGGAARTPSPRPTPAPCPPPLAAPSCSHRLVAEGSSRVALGRLQEEEQRRSEPRGGVMVAGSRGGGSTEWLLPYRHQTRRPRRHAAARRPATPTGCAGEPVSCTPTEAQPPAWAACEKEAVARMEPPQYVPTLPGRVRAPANAWRRSAGWCRGSPDAASTRTGCGRGALEQQR